MKRTAEKPRPLEEWGVTLSLWRRGEGGGGGRGDEGGVSVSWRCV